MNVLSISQLSVALENGAPLITHVDLQIAPGSVHALMGPNGSGKSSLAYTIMGHPAYTIAHGSIAFNDQAIEQLSPDKRARLGIFLSFQHPFELPGVNVITFLKEIYCAKYTQGISNAEFMALLEPYLKLLAIDHHFLNRCLNDGFSGGEKKKFEILQMLVLKPKLVILDEIDSGLDVDALKYVDKAIEYARAANPELALLIITHYRQLLNFIIPDYIHIMRKGAKIITGAASLSHVIEEKGYDAFI